MKLRFNPRTWHAWLSVIISPPILIVALSAIFISHGQVLGFRDIKVSPSWLPGYRESAGQDPRRDARSVLQSSDGLWIGTRAGLYLQTQSGLQSIGAFEVQEIRSLLATDRTPLVLTQQGLWAKRAAADGSAQNAAGDPGKGGTADRSAGDPPTGDWQRVYRGPVLSGYAADGAAYIVTRDKGLLKSSDNGRTWAAPEEVRVALSALPEAANAGQGQQITLAKLIRDLHTGEALLGHDADWVWSDIVGATITFLACTGIYMWWRGQRKAVFARQKRQGDSVARAPAEGQV